MKKLGKKQLTLHLAEPLARIPAELAGWGLELADGGGELVYTFDANASNNISALLRRLTELAISFKDLNTHQSSLEEIFVGLVSERA
jgi:ABC-2 type transport system ATP-binding protein